MKITIYLQDGELKEWLEVREAYWDQVQLCKQWKADNPDSPKPIDPEKLGLTLADEKALALYAERKRRQLKLAELQEHLSEDVFHQIRDEALWYWRYGTVNKAKKESK